MTVRRFLGIAWLLSGLLLMAAISMVPKQPGVCQSHTGADAVAMFALLLVAAVTLVLVAMALLGD